MARQASTVQTSALSACHRMQPECAGYVLDPRPASAGASGRDITAYSNVVHSSPAQVAPMINKSVPNGPSTVNRHLRQREVAFRHSNVVREAECGAACVKFCVARAPEELGRWARAVTFAPPEGGT